MYPLNVVKSSLTNLQALDSEGIAYYMSRWYTKDELVFRLAMYIVMAPLAGGE
jgi:hypothetical protein